MAVCSDVPVTVTLVMALSSDVPVTVTLVMALFSDVLFTAHSATHCPISLPFCEIKYKTVCHVEINMPKGH